MKVTSVKKSQNLLAALLLTLVLCLTTFHEATAAHSDKHHGDSCAVCIISHSLQTADFSPTTNIPEPVVIEINENLFSQYIDPVVSHYFDIAAPRGPPVALL